MAVMGIFTSLFGGASTPLPSSVVFEMREAAYTYEDGNIGLRPTTLTITPRDRRVAVIGLNGAGKTTLLKLLDGAFAATTGKVTITAGNEQCDPSVKKQAKRVEAMIGRVRREEIPNSYYQAKDIGAAVDASLKTRKIPDSERMAIIGNLFAHFGLSDVARQPASALDSLKRHLLAIAAALSVSPAAIVADEPTKGLDEIDSAKVAKALFTYDKQVIFATHDIDLIRRPEYAIDRVLVVDDHAIVFDGKPEEAAAFYDELVRRAFEAAKTQMKA